MKFIRTFHTIGQGAFYSERYTDDAEKFTVVYDCGSKTLNSKTLQKKIKSTFSKGETIDILFISHFHADHVNGIEHLKNHCDIKNVVMPFLNTDAKVLIKVNNVLENKDSNTLLVDDPGSFFKRGTKIITVSGREPDGDNTQDSRINLENVKSISDIGNGQEIDSGTPISAQANVIWYYIPFNYEYQDRLNLFLEKLEEEDLELDDINTITKIVRNKRKIRKAMDRVEGNLNVNSLILYSGDGSNDKLYNHSQHYYFFHHPFGSLRGCLYLGDSDLNQPDLIVDLKNRLNPVFNSIGVIQLPHHGSILNFNENILENSRITQSVISYGTTNTYGHPSDSVIGNTLSHHIGVHCITEKEYTRFMQHT